MSLLNDALRDLEQRRDQNNQQGPAVPSGLAPQRRTSGWEMVAVLSAVVIALVLVLGAGFWAWSHWFSDRGLPMVADERGEAEMPAMQTPVETVQTGSVERFDSVEPVAEPMPDESEPEAATPEVVALQRSEQLSAPAQEAERQQTDPTEQPSEPIEAEQVAQAEPEPAPEPEPEAQNVQVREMTPQERERQLTREIEGLLENGQLHQAEEQLRAHLVLDSDAPGARSVMARHHLRRGDTQAARQWVPQSVAELYPELRMVRARIELSEGDREGALKWLAMDPPPVARHTNYHSMMATLYQQTEQPNEAARVWGQLLETDDAQARWWAGLGIALEAQGQQQGARSAFTQAAQLPGLPPALRDYVEQRLASQG